MNEEMEIDKWRMNKEARSTKVWNDLISFLLLLFEI